MPATSISCSLPAANRKVFIVARGEEPGSEQKLLRAGADKVESPIAWATENGRGILDPDAGGATFPAGTGHEGGGGIGRWRRLWWALPLLSRGCRCRTLGIRQNLNLILVAIKRADGEMLFNPSHETPILVEIPSSPGVCGKTWTPWRRWCCEDGIAISGQPSAFSKRTG